MTTRFIGGPLHGQSTADHFKSALEMFSASEDANVRYRRVIYPTRSEGASAPGLHTFYVHVRLAPEQAQAHMKAMVEEETEGAGR
jgi:hypothetical protein